MPKIFFVALFIGCWLGFGLTAQAAVKTNKTVVDKKIEIDSDKDGLSDRFEKILGTDPQQTDSDGDGYPDGT